MPPLLTVSFRLDDWLALAALFTTLTICAMGIYLPQHGVGTHIWTIQETQLVHLFQIYYAGVLTFTISLAFSKLSVLAFYVRVFGLRKNTSSKWKVSFSVVLLVTLAWPISNIVYSCLQCRPIERYWNLTVSGHCLPSFPGYLQAALLNVFNDVLILVLPLPNLLKLHMKRDQKTLLVSVFVCGYRLLYSRNVLFEEYQACDRLMLVECSPHVHRASDYYDRSERFLKA